jgi:hypothetical protein
VGGRETTAARPGLSQTLTVPTRAIDENAGSSVGDIFTALKPCDLLGASEQTGAAMPAHVSAVPFAVVIIVPLSAAISVGGTGRGTSK